MSQKCSNLIDFPYVLPVYMAGTSFDENAILCASDFVDDGTFSHNMLYVVDGEAYGRRM